MPTHVTTRSLSALAAVCPATGLQKRASTLQLSYPSSLPAGGGRRAAACVTCITTTKTCAPPHAPAACRHAPVVSHAMQRAPATAPRHACAHATQPASLPKRRAMAQAARTGGGGNCTPAAARRQPRQSTQAQSSHTHHCAAQVQMQEARHSKWLGRSRRIPSSTRMPRSIEAAKPGTAKVKSCSTPPRKPPAPRLSST